jgi:hypothetical protein
MGMHEPQRHQPGSLHALEPGEELHERLATDDYVLDVTNRRLLLAYGERIRMDLPIDSIRRIQFDVEARRPATFVIVPDLPHEAPQVLAVTHGHMTRATRILAFVGERLSQGAA